MNKRTKQTDKRKKRKTDNLRRNVDHALLNAKSKKYSTITSANINALKGEAVDIIENVLARHITRRTLPSALDNAFPPITGANWCRSPVRFTSSFSIEAKWALARIGSNFQQLNALLKLRREFAVQLLLNDLISAAKTLEQTVQYFGISSWSIEMELLLAEYRGGFEANREALSRILERPLHHNEHLLAEFSSQRVDSTLSILHYSRSITSFVADGGYESRNKSLPFFLTFSLIPQLAHSGFVDPVDAAFFLHSYCSRPLIDAYLALVKLLRHAICNDGAALVTQITGADQLNRILDPELNSLLICCFDKSRNNDSDALSEALLHHRSGQHMAAMAIAEKHIVSEPLNFAWYELIATVSAIERVDLPKCLPIGSKAQGLLESVRAVLNYNEDTGNAFSSLLKNAVALEGTPLGFQITGFCCRFAPAAGIASNWVTVLFSQNLEPTRIPFLPKSHQTASMRHIELHYPEASVAVAREMHNWIHKRPDAVVPRHLDRTTELLLRADVDHFTGRHSQAVNSYMQIISDKMQPAIRIAAAVRGAFACHLALNEFNEAATLLSSTSIEPDAVFFLVNLSAVAKAYTSRSSQIDKRSIAWPILLMLNYKIGHTPLEDVFAAYANFIEAAGVARPSHFGIGGVTNYGELQFRFFLRWICHPNILDSDIEFAGTTDVEGERVAILQLLQEIDPDNTVQYAEEISLLQQQLAVRKAMRHVAQSKIHFNAEGIEQSLDPSYTERFERYCAMARLSEAARKSVDLHWDHTSATAELITEAPVVLFKELFHEMRYAFLFSNEHGLDSYLSVRIRHQTITGALRSVFERIGLVTEKSDGIYCNNVTWRDDLDVFNELQREQVQDAFSKFSQTVDDIISIVSNQWMRIRGAPGGDNGLFVMDFLDEELVAYQKQLQDVSSVFDFVDFIFARLRERLTLSLCSTRTRFEGELREAFESALHVLYAALERACGDIPGSIAAGITFCRTELQNGISEICEWFQLQDSGQLEDFSVQTLVVASIENIGKCFPSSEFQCTVECADDIKLSGKCFVPLWDAFFLVFENVVRYSGDGSANTSLVITSNSDVIVFTITNPLGAAQDEASVKERLEKIRNYTPEMIRKEEGSGFPKLRNLIRSDLGLDEDRVEFNAEGRTFTTRFELKREGVSA